VLAANFGRETQTIALNLQAPAWRDSISGELLDMGKDPNLPVQAGHARLLVSRP